MDIGWSRARFAETRVARLATANGAGRPHLVPIVFVLVDDDLSFAVDAKPKADPGSGRLKRLDNIRANPAVSVLVDAYSDDWTQLWWARADGTARIIDAADPDATAPRDALIRRYPQYQITPPPGPVVTIAVHHWAGWSALR